MCKWLSALITCGVSIVANGQHCYFCAEEKCRGAHCCSFQAIVGVLCQTGLEKAVSVPLLCPPFVYPLASLHLLGEEPAASHPFWKARFRTSVSVGNQSCLHLCWLDQMNDCRCHQVLSTEFNCLWTNILFCFSAFVLGTSAIPELKQTFFPET